MRGTSDRKGEMQRKDLDTLTVLETVKAHGIDAIDHLLRDFPEKVILAAYRHNATPIPQPPEGWDDLT